MLFYTRGAGRRVPFPRSEGFQLRAYTRQIRDSSDFSVTLDAVGRLPRAWRRRHGFTERPAWQPPGILAASAIAVKIALGWIRRRSPATAGRALGL
jgi:hypothetical protein